MHRKEEEADELYFEAMEATTQKERKQLLNAALKIFPEHIDAKIGLIVMEKNSFKALEQLVKLEEFARLELLKAGLFTEESIGHFWGLIETRPFMRVLHRKLIALKEVGFLFEASGVGAEMLTLCQSDNLGIRYELLDVYTEMLNSEGVTELATEYGERYSIDFGFAELYTHVAHGEYELAKKCAQKTEKNNPGFIDFFSTIDLQKIGMAMRIANTGRYSVGEEFYVVLSQHSQKPYFNQTTEFLKTCKK